MSVVAGLTTAAHAAVVPTFEWSDLTTVGFLGGAGQQVVNQLWQNIMTLIYGAGLQMLRLAFEAVDSFTTPDLSRDGVMSKVYPITFTVGASLALVVGLVQVGIAAFQRSGQGLARLAVGLMQFLAVWLGMVGLGAALVAATAGLTQGILQAGLDVTTFAQIDISKGWQPRDAVDAVAATALGLCGMMLMPAAIGYLLMMLVRAATLMILLSTSPISAAGLLSESTRSWFWKTLRWFLAAVFMGPLAALVLTIGTKLTEGVLAKDGDSTTAAVGAAVVGTVLVILGAFMPMVLFRLLAFVDPGTSTGASFRTSMDMAGGLGGLLGGKSAPGGAGNGAATNRAGNVSGGEAAAGAATQSRVMAALGPVAAALGPVGAAAGAMSTVGQKAMSYGSDVLGAAGIGHQSPYYPGQDSHPGSGAKRPTQGPSTGPGEQPSSSGSASQKEPGESSPSQTPPGATPPPTPPPPPGPAPGAGARQGAEVGAQSAAT